jgi:hypothetical protein
MFNRVFKLNALKSQTLINPLIKRKMTILQQTK